MAIEIKGKTAHPMMDNATPRKGVIETKFGEIKWEAGRLDDAEMMTELANAIFHLGTPQILMMLKAANESIKRIRLSSTADGPY